MDSFPTETKDRLISRLSYKGDENLLDYWIHLGRLEADQAIDAAMRMSDNQLFLYAYLQKLETVSSYTTISGEIKSDQMNSLKEKIKTLANELGIEYQNSDTGSE
ncbi:type VII secretion protein EssB/YukC [Lacrimispora sp.]|uniref:type VII secretion protein EssB/YukC n=1 Tax=Lacrimispora sp. TaxID=2719234 RepID=UPI00289FDDE8|nr:type VII secretion protein EssB/YukC [Lacrimispora sp.]